MESPKSHAPDVIVLPNDTPEVQIQQMISQENTSRLQEIQTHIMLKQEYEKQRESELKQLIFAINQDVKNASEHSNSISKLLNLYFIKDRIEQSNITPEQFKEIQDKEYYGKLLAKIGHEYSKASQQLTENHFATIDKFYNGRSKIAALIKEISDSELKIPKIQSTIQETETAIRRLKNPGCLGRLDVLIIWGVLTILVQWRVGFDFGSFSQFITGILGTIGGALALTVGFVWVFDRLFSRYRKSDTGQANMATKLEQAKAKESKLDSYRKNLETTEGRITELKKQLDENNKYIEDFFEQNPFLLPLRKEVLSES